MAQEGQRAVMETCVVQVRSSKTDASHKYPSFEGVLYKARNNPKPNELTYGSEELRRLDLRGEPIYVEHDRKLGSVGVIVENRFEDPYLIIVGSINTKNRELRENIREHLRSGRLRDLSIGFKGVQNTKTGEYISKEFVEGSLVEQGYYDETRIISVQASGKPAAATVQSILPDATSHLLQEKMAAAENLPETTPLSPVTSAKKIEPKNSYLMGAESPPSTTTGESEKFSRSSQAMEVDAPSTQSPASAQTAAGGAASSEALDNSDSGASPPSVAAGAVGTGAKETNAAAAASAAATTLTKSQLERLEAYERKERERNRPRVEAQRAAAKEAGVSSELMDSTLEEMANNPATEPLFTLMEHQQKKLEETNRRIAELTKQQRDLKRKYVPNFVDTELPGAAAPSTATTVVVASSGTPAAAAAAKPSLPKPLTPQQESAQKRARIPSPAAEPIPVVNSGNEMMAGLHSILNRQATAGQHTAARAKQPLRSVGAAAFGNQTVVPYDEATAMGEGEHHRAADEEDYAASAATSHTVQVSATAGMKAPSAADYLANSYIRPVHLEVYANCTSKTRNEQILKEQASRAFFKHSLSNVYVHVPGEAQPRPAFWDMCLEASAGKLTATTPIQCRVPVGKPLSAYSGAFGINVEQSEHMGW
jgi:hypothetical protein